MFGIVGLQSTTLCKVERRGRVTAECGEARIGPQAHGATSGALRAGLMGRKRHVMSKSLGLHVHVRLDDGALERAVWALDLTCRKIIHISFRFVWSEMKVIPYVG